MINQEVSASEWSSWLRVAAQQRGGCTRGHAFRLDRPDRVPGLDPPAARSAVAGLARHAPRVQRACQVLVQRRHQ